MTNKELCDAAVEGWAKAEMARELNMSNAIHLLDLVGMCAWAKYSVAAIKAGRPYLRWGEWGVKTDGSSKD